MAQESGTVESEKPVTKPELEKKQSKADKVDSVKRRDGYYRLTIGGIELKFASVTTILKVIDKPALGTWMAKQAAGLVLENPHEYSTAEKAASGVFGKRDSAGDRGTAVHEATELLDTGTALDFVLEGMDPAYHGYLRAYDRFLKVSPYTEILHSEVTLYSTVYDYAGTTDRIIRWGDEVWLIDFKTSGQLYPEVGLQLEAYRKCNWLLKGEELTPMPKVDRMAAIRLGADGQYEFRTYEGDFQAFLAAKRLWEWRKNN